MEQEVKDCVEVSAQQVRQYWQTQLADELPVLDFPGDVAATEQAPATALAHFSIDSALTQALRDYSQQTNGTLFTGVVALLTSVLHWYTRQQDIIVTTSLSAPDGSGFEALPLRLRPRPADSFAAVLAQATEVAAQAAHHRAFTLDAAAQALELTPEVVARSLRALQLVYQAEGAPVADATPAATRTALLVRVAAGEELEFTLEYDAGRYSPALMAQLGRHCRQLLAALLAAPAQPIGRAALLSEPEKRQLLQEFNASAIAFPENGQTIVELFENMVRQHPDKTALVFEGQELTYRELNERADQLARRLLALAPVTDAAGQNRLVAICLERGFNVYVAMLASLKSGAGYVPLDPHYPEERVAFMLQDTQARLVLTEPKMLAAKPYLAGEGRQMVILGEEAANDAPAAPLALPRRVAGSDVAYVIYTSGSTGLPKGVLIEHDQIAATLLHMRNYYGLSAADTCVYYRSYCFDGSIEETLLPMISGARVIIVPTNTEEDLVAYLYRVIEQYGVTKINTPPAFLHLFLDRIESGAALHSLRHLVSGGDVLNKSLIGRLHANLTAKVHNTYGPTENTIDSTVFEVDRAAHYHTIPIGRPVANSSCYVLNEFLQPVPLGVVGELCVGGTGVGRGYLNRPELTAEKFIANPFAAVAELGYANERIYRTGDLARWLPDGTIEFLGRIDNQVKIRGFRIELEEIEAALLKHPEIDSAVVVVRQFENSKELVAYLVSKVPQSADALRGYLKAKMPDYMVPSYFVQLAQMPISTTGKVNKAALPDPKTNALSGSQQHVGARNSREAKLIEIWQEVLNRDTIGVKDNFIDMGGTSLSAIQVILKLRTDGYKISTRDFLENLVLEEQAAVLNDDAAQAVEPTTQNVTVALSPAQQALVQQPAAAHPALVLQARGWLSEAMLSQVLDKLLSHHEVLRAALVQAGGQWQLEIPPTAKPLIAYFDHRPFSEAEAAEEERQVLAAARQEELGQGMPAVKFLVFRRAQADRVAIVAHAALLDAAAWQVLVADMVTLFAQAEKNSTLALPAKAHGFQRWMDELAAAPAATAAEQAFWQAATEASAGSRTSAEPAAEQVRLVIPSISQAALATANQAFDTDSAQLVLTAFLGALRAELGLTTAAVELAASAREAGGEEGNSLGNFTVNYPLGLALNDFPVWEAALAAVRHQVEQVPGKGTGYAAGAAAQNAPAGVPPFRFAYQEASFADALTDSPFQAAEYEAAAPLALSAGLDFSATLLDNDQLQVVLRYAPGQYSATVVEAIGRSFEAGLRQTVAACAARVAAQGPLYRISYNQQYFFRSGDIDQSRGVLPEFVFPTASVALFQSLCTQFLAALDILRVRFERHHGEIFQRVAPAATVVPDVRRHQVADAHNAAATEAVFQRELHQPFQFSDQQLVRFVVVHDAQVARCQIVVHHAVTDGASNQLLVQLIQSLMSGQMEPLQHFVQTAPRYWDYIRWQSRFMRSATARQQLSYWTTNLAGFEHTAPLGGKAEEEQFDYLFRISQVIQGDSHERILAFCKAYEIDLSSFFLTAFALTLYARSGAEETIVDIFSNGRDQLIPGVAVPQLVGVIANKLPIKLRLSEQMSFGQVCKQVMEVYYEGRLHQQIPYIEMEKALRAACQHTLGDFVQVRFNYFDYSAFPFGKGTEGFTSQAKEVKLIGNNAAVLSNYRLILDCKAYQDTVKLEWKYPCTETFEGWEDTILPIVRLITESTQAPLSRIGAEAAAPEAAAESADDLVTMTI
ncbi:amino acid adenylation domain-containing protein [Hymenobacter aquaticus]|uniref:Amino acid adenylation domain-containing protein n=1 Tax=Hymenobacter aquaticus TaxID=1867101 RepID=A0A4Z0PVH8_9BACT|nr:non-ribosomal peptide synthetase [Hymenobacter aquaticus]TGE21495.1 amino acid adenylation domain-containing protein [Hymenobacter aquaticus]